MLASMQVLYSAVIQQFLVHGLVSMLLLEHNPGVVD